MSKDAVTDEQIYEMASKLRAEKENAHAVSSANRPKSWRCGSESRPIGPKGGRPEGCTMDLFYELRYDDTNELVPGVARQPMFGRIAFHQRKV